MSSRPGKLWEPRSESQEKSASGQDSQGFGALYQPRSRALASAYGFSIDNIKYNKILFIHQHKALSKRQTRATGGRKATGLSESVGSPKETHGTLEVEDWRRSLGSVLPRLSNGPY